MVTVLLRDPYSFFMIIVSVCTLERQNLVDYLLYRTFHILVIK